MRSRSLFLPGFLTLLALIVLIGLGTWQMQRLHWKEDLLQRVTARIAAPAVPLPPAGWPTLDLKEWEYRPVEVSGTFRHDLETRVYVLLTEPRGPLSGPGYFILTPLETGEGRVLINRGFVPLETASFPRLEGLTVVKGLLRGPEDRNMFTPADESSERLFYARDPAPIATALGIPLAPFTIDAVETLPGGLPQAGETRVNFPNRHLEYALTWYGLAGALLAVFAAFAWSRMRRR
ncbi:SURF1-like protein [Terrihabitans soli]|uniref:SURF1-like protein n=1 Tax=Terrihabitans soli TaxID=708113 RepID=A0A6S6QK22_9HYPH|nr:SURF1 family protein [Terrihabitans soli]BCJ91643.1 SURF1-like protein [Terrihabitans soli]